jgi:branched-chain amino acid transport system ATP-binding protein
MLELLRLCAGYGRVSVLKEIELYVDEGEIVCLIGANGAGKTTTLGAICGIVRVFSGKVMLSGQDVTNLNTKDLVRLGITLVPEGRRLFPDLTVMENLELGAWLRRSKTEVKEDFDKVFSLFPVLYDRRRQMGGTLSGGEQQMLAIGRALMARPKLLLLDEPSLGLAPKLVQKIFDVIREINKAGTTIFLIEQNANMALEVANRGYVMETGQIVLHDKAETLLRNEEVRRAYLGV